MTDTVLEFKNTNVQSYKEFFKWVTDSIKTSSVSVESNSTGFELAKLDGVTIEKIDLTKSAPNRQFVDDNFVVLNGKCQNTKRPYLMKYRKAIAQSSFAGIELGTKSYRLVGAYQVDKLAEPAPSDTAKTLQPVSLIFLKAKSSDRRAHV